MSNTGYNIIYSNENGDTVHLEPCADLREVFTDILAQIVSSNLYTVTVVELTYDQTKEISGTRVLLMFDREGLHQLDCVGSINLLSTEPYIGGTR